MISQCCPAALCILSAVCLRRQKDLQYLYLCSVLQSQRESSPAALTCRLKMYTFCLQDSDQIESRSLAPSQSGSGLSTGGHTSGGTGHSSEGTSSGSQKRLRPTAAATMGQRAQPTTSRHANPPLQSHVQQIHGRWALLRRTDSLMRGSQKDAKGPGCQVDKRTTGSLDTAGKAR